jgi:hypothetical protein
MFNLGSVRGEYPTAVLTQNAPVLLENMITSGSPYVKNGNDVQTTKSRTRVIYWHILGRNNWWILSTYNAQILCITNIKIYNYTRMRSIAFVFPAFVNSITHGSFNQC